MMLRVVLILALALVLALDGGMMFGHGGLRHSMAWAGAEGYVLHYEIYDRTQKPHDSKARLPNEQAFLQAVRDWAVQNKIQLSENGWLDAPRFVGLNQGGASGGRAQAVTFNGYDVMLIGVSAVERDELAARLAPLAGVAPPSVSDYAKNNLHSGVPDAHVPKKVLINGATYSFPRDFSPAEVSALQGYFRYGLDQVYYWAFKTLGGGSKSEPDRFDLGDVVQIERNAAGDLLLTTLAKVWDEGRILRNDTLFQEQVASRGDGGWSVAMSRTLPEPGYDPLQALATAGNRSARRAHAYDFPDRTDYSYRFFPEERMLAAGAPKYAPEEAAQAKELVAQLDAAFNAFQLAHPEYWDLNLHRYRVQHGCSSFGEMPLEYRINVAGTDGALSQEVLALLSQIPGLPDAQVEHRVLQAQRQSAVAFEPPPMDATFTMPPLPPPNPAQWHAMQGYKLVYYVMGRMRDGAPRFNETDSNREFSHTVAAWATEHNLPVNPQPSMVPLQPVLGPNGAPLPVSTPDLMPFASLRFPDTALYLAGPSGMGMFGAFAETQFTLYLATADAALPGSLVTVLQAVPGTAAPKIEPCKFYVHDSHPKQPLTGGDLVVDAKRYRFPDDFAWEEAQNLSYRRFSPGVVEFTAFYALVDPKRNRIPFPDVARMDSLADGSTLLTTYKKDWPEGRALHEAQQGYSCGASVPLLAVQAKDGYDPLPALLRQLQPRDYKVQAKNFYTLLYYIAPQDQWLAEYTAGADGANVAQRQAVFTQLDARITAWLKEHPEYKATEAVTPRVGCSPFPYHGLYLGASVSICGDDDALALELTALLAGIPGLPAPVVEQQLISSF